MLTDKTSSSELQQLSEALQTARTEISGRHLALLYDILRHKENGDQEKAAAREGIADQLVAAKDHLFLAQEGIDAILFPSEAHRWLDMLLTAPGSKELEGVLDSLQSCFLPEHTHIREKATATQYWGKFADGSLLEVWIHKDPQGEISMDGYTVATAAEMESRGDSPENFQTIATHWLKKLQTADHPDGEFEEVLRHILDNPGTYHRDAITAVTEYDARWPDKSGFIIQIDFSQEPGRRLVGYALRDRQGETRENTLRDYSNPKTRAYLAALHKILQADQAAQASSNKR